jgi:Ca2+-binding RTX toxin-like protein
MKNPIPLKGSRAMRPAVMAIAVAAVIAGASGIATVQGNAAAAVKTHAAVKAHKSRHLRKEPKFKHPKLKHGVLTITGTDASDAIALRLQAGEPGVLQVDVGDDGYADFSFPRADISRIEVDAGEGDDLVRIDESNGSFTDSIPTTIDGGDGNDNLIGGSGAETLIGGYGDDTIDGKKGNDLALMGAGDDTFVWDPGDGSDTIEGQAGNDTMRFNGADAAERVALSANGSRLTFLRAPGNVTMDTAGVERVDFNALGGADTVTVDDLRGTDVSSVNIDLAGTLGGNTGDGQADSVTVFGTGGNDAVTAVGSNGAASVTGLAATVNITNAEPANDALAINTLDGDDSIDATGLAASAVKLTLDGGNGNDRLAGGPGVETLRGGDGDDTIDGNGGNDLALLGAGDDTFVWDPGDGSDTVEGQDGTDTMLFNGGGGTDQVDLSANGNRLKFFRVQGTITMDTAGVEIVDFNALGGADTVTVNDLTGTDVKSVNVDLAGTLGGNTGDGQADRVIVNGTAGDDTIRVNGDATEVVEKGLVPTIGILHAEAANDRLEINDLAGTDTVNSGGLAAGAIQLFVDGVLVP